MTPSYGASFVRLEHLFQDRQGRLSAALMPDFVHLSEVGYALLETTLAPVVHASLHR